MVSITLTLDDVITGRPINDGHYLVECAHKLYNETFPRRYEVDISASSVTVYRVGDGGELREASSVLVSTTLVDATRRLFGLVGQS